MAPRKAAKHPQRPVVRPTAPRPPRGRGRPPAGLRWLVDAPRLARLRVEWAGLSPEFREAVRLQALTRGKYLLEVLEAKGLTHNAKRAEETQ